MIKKVYSIHLATPEEQSKHKEKTKHKGKWECPRCGETTFVPFVDSEGNPIADEFGQMFGRCERVNSCKYFYSPKGKGGKSKAVYKKEPPQQPIYIESDEFKKSVMATYTATNHLVTFLRSVFGETETAQMIAEYYIGTSNHWNGATVFFQIDELGRVRRGKIMLYYPDKGKRRKKYNNTVHALKGISDKNPPQCLFGLHLLNDFPDKHIALVESEKTAIIASRVFTDCIFMATGSCSNLTYNMCAPLKGRNVVLFPDNGKFAKWQDKQGNWLDGWSEKGKDLRNIFKTLQISDVMERPEILERYHLHKDDDIADLLLACKLDIKGIDFGFHQL